MCFFVVLLPFGSRFPGKHISILATGALVEPVTGLHAIAGRSPNGSGKLFKTTMKGIVCRKIGNLDLVLRVRKRGDSGNNLIHIIYGMNNGNFNLHKNFGQIYAGFTVILSVENRCSSLSAIDNLHIANALDGWLSVFITENFNTFCSHRNAIVICKKHIRLIPQCVTNALVDIAFYLQK